ncbi:MAG: HAD family hydrolase [Bryobacteraceae bacterium]
MPALDAILFDFDGVLADTEPVHYACWAEVLAPFGVVLTWEYYRNHAIGVDDRVVVRELAAAAQPPLDWKFLFAQYPAKKRLFRQRTLGAPPFDAALDGFLSELHRDYKLAVVSSSSRAEIEQLLVAGDLRKHFDTVVTGEDVARHKPDPEPYLEAARRLGATAALVVEDSAIGQASGRAAGYEVLAVTHPKDVPVMVRRKLKEL